MSAILAKRCYSVFLLSSNFQCAAIVNVRDEFFSSGCMNFQMSKIHIAHSYVTVRYVSSSVHEIHYLNKNHEKLRDYINSVPTKCTNTQARARITMERSICDFHRTEIYDVYLQTFAEDSFTMFDRDEAVQLVSTCEKLASKQGILLRNTEQVSKSNGIQCRDSISLKVEDTGYMFV